MNDKNYTKGKRMTSKDLAEVIIRVDESLNGAAGVVHHIKNIDEHLCKLNGSVADNIRAIELARYIANEAIEHSKEVETQLITACNAHEQQVGSMRKAMKDYIVGTSLALVAVFGGIIAALII